MQSKKLSKEFFVKAQEFAGQVVDGLNSSVSPYHSVRTIKDLLNTGGFTEIRETDKWALETGGKYYFTRNNSSIAAFVIGKGCENTPPQNFKVIGCHTDSPCLRLAPITRAKSCDFEQVAIQTYGGGLWATWFDRSLSLAGRVIIKNTETNALEERFMHHKEPLLQIPNLAIHLDSHERGKFSWDNDANLRPILATSVIDALLDPQATPVKREEGEEEPESEYGIEKKHLSSFLDLVAREVETTQENIVDFELSLFDTHPASIIGLHKEFISSPRLDNMCSSICATHALIERAENVTEESTVEMIILYDHEEIGSASAQGAAGTLCNDALRRIFINIAKEDLTGELLESYQIALQKSLFVSADMAHAQHPNYAGIHQPNHTPRIHGGIVLKMNANQRYMTDSANSAIMREIANRCGVPLQDFMIKQGTGCGSTIGPAIAQNTGMKTVDIGSPQLAMHSIREMCGTTDTYYYKELFREFFDSFTDVSGDLLCS